MPRKKSETKEIAPANFEAVLQNHSEVDLSTPGIRAAVQLAVKQKIDEYCVEAYDDGHRWHLGASLIGHECSRYLWYIFRWCFREGDNKPASQWGRQQRLFNRGHREEARFVEWLRGIGFQVWEFADEEAKKQIRISGCNGHFGGSLDGVAKFPADWKIEKPVLLEFKTNGTGKGFADLAKDGMQEAKPQHFAQTSVYGYKMGFEHVLYLNICKNDDDLHVEVVKLDHSLGQQMETKAEGIIASDKPPARLSDNPTFHKCGYCSAKEICHNGELVLKNCRSCKNAQPIENGEWACKLHGAQIPREFVPTGCDSWESVN